MLVAISVTTRGRTRRTSMECGYSDVVRIAKGLGYFATSDTDSAALFVREYAREWLRAVRRRS